MTPATAPHWVLKDLVADLAEPRPALIRVDEINTDADREAVTSDATPATIRRGVFPGECVAATVKLITPGVPALYLLLDSIEPEQSGPVRGVHFVEDQPQRFHFVNLPPWKFEFAAGRRRRTLLLVQLPEGTTSPVRVVYVDGTGRYQALGELQRSENVWSYVSAPAASLPLVPLAPPKLQPQYFFVGGTPKSGTTWVEKILNGHPQTLCLGQGGFFEPVMFPMLRTELEHDPRNFVQWNLPRRDYDFEIGAFLAGRALLAFHSYSRLWPGLAAVGDRSPLNSLAYQTIHSYLGECRIIHCVRHPLDVVVSRLFHEWNLYRDGRTPLCELDEKGLAQLDGRLSADNGALRLDINDAVLLDPFLDEWIRLHEHALGFQNEHAELILMVHYEKLLADFDRVSDRMFKFVLGKPLRNRAEQEMVRGVSSFENLSGGRSRGTVDQRSFFRNGTAGDYRGRFSPSLLEYARNKVGQLAADFGYSIEA